MRKQLARGVADFLGVQQVAGVVIGGDRADFAFGAHRAQLVEELVHVADLRRPGGAGSLVGVVPVVAVVFEHRPAAGDVVDDRVEPVGLESGAVLVGELACRLARAGVEVNRPAADLRWRHVDVAAVVLQHAGRGPIDVAEHRVADAADEQRDRGPALADGGQELRQRAFVALRRRQHVDHPPQIGAEASA